MANKQHYNPVIVGELINELKKFDVSMPIFRMAQNGVQDTIVPFQCIFDQINSYEVVDNFYEIVHNKNDYDEFVRSQINPCVLIKIRA